MQLIRENDRNPILKCQKENGCRGRQPFFYTRGSVMVLAYKRT